MKHTGKVLLGLLLLMWLLLRFIHQPTPPAAETTVSIRAGQVASVASMPAGDLDLPEPMPVEEPPEESGRESAPSEDSWGKELRELKELAARDPDAALVEVARMPDKHERKAAATAVCAIVAGKDPAKAMTAAWELQLGVLADESTEHTALENLAKAWAGADLPNALLWASALPADEEWRRDRVIKGIALALAKIAPAEAARLVAEKIDSGSNVQIDAAMGVLRAWAARDYSGAVAWASLFGEGPLRERSLEELAAGPIGKAPSAPSR